MAFTMKAIFRLTSHLAKLVRTSSVQKKMAVVLSVLEVCMLRGAIWTSRKVSTRKS